MPKAKAAFEITGWDERTVEDPEDGPKLGRVTVTKTFTGDVEGTSSAQLMMTGDESGRGYVAIERFVGKVQGRSGSFVFQHGGIQGEGVLHNFGHLIPGSGTDELAGIRGDGRLEHDESGARFTLDYELA